MANSMTPALRSAAWAGGFRVHVRFSDGVEAVVDLASCLNGPVFAPLRDPRRFGELRIDGSGSTIEWPHGADIAPETLYEYALQAAAAVTSAGPAASGSPAGEAGAGPQRPEAESPGGEGCVPEISRFFGIVIRMFFNDHAPPHFHADYAEHRASFDIATGRVLTGALPPRALRLVAEWLDLHRAELLDDWQRAAAGQALRRIAPLD